MNTNNNLQCFKSAVAFFFLFFLHGFSIENGQQGISYNRKSIAVSGGNLVQIFNIITENEYRTKNK